MAAAEPSANPSAASPQASAPPSASLPSPPSASFDLPEPPGAAEALAAAEQAAREALVTSFFSAEPPAHLAHLVAHRNALSPMRQDIAKLGWSDHDAFEMVQAAAALGVSQGQLAGLAQTLVKRGRASLQTPEQRLAATERALDDGRTRGEKLLVAEWGERYGDKLNTVRRAARHVFGERFEELTEMRLADGSKLGHHPALHRALADYAAGNAAVVAAGIVARPEDLLALGADELRDKAALYLDQNPEIADPDAPKTAAREVKVRTWNRLLALAGANAGEMAPRRSAPPVPPAKPHFFPQLGRLEEPAETAGQLRAQIQADQQGPWGAAWLDRWHPDHERAVRHFDALHERAARAPA